MRNIFTALLIALTLSASAQSDSTKPKADTLKEVQVVGITNKSLPITQTIVKLSDVPYLLQQQDFFFVIDKATPSIYAQSDNGQENGYCYLRMRGLDQTRINFNLNGIPLNEMEDQGLYFSNMPGFNNYLGSVDVERGIGSSKYGNTSVAGSVDMETRSMSEKTIEAQALIKNSTNDANYNAFYSSGISKDGLALQVGGTYLNANGYKDHSGNQGGSVYYGLGLFKKKNIFKLYGFNGVAHNQLAFYGVPMPMIDSYYKTNLNLTSDKDTFKQNMIAFNWINFANQKYKFNTSVYYDNVNGTYSTSDILFGVKSHQLGIMSNMVMEREKNTTNIGVNTNIYSRMHFGYDNNGFYDLPQNSQYYSNTGHKEDAIAYIKGMHKEKNFDLFYDAQARAVWFNTTDSKQYSWLFFNPKVGIKTTQGANSYYFNAAITQREPTRTDMIQNVVQNDSNLRGANTDNSKFLKYDTIKLHPELVHDLELGDRYHKGNLDVNINTYFMLIDHEFAATGVIDPYSGFMVKRAVQSTIRDGVECNIKLKIKRINIFFNTQFQHNSLSLGSSDYAYKIPFTPDFIGSAGVSYNLKYIDFGVVEQNVSSMVMSLDDQSYTSTPYSILNTFADIKWKHVLIALRVNNVLNNKYYIPAGIAGTPTFYVGQLVNYSISLKIKF